LRRHVSVSWRVLSIRFLIKEMFMSPVTTSHNACNYDVAILGAGYAGLMAALRLGGKSKALRIVLINASDRFLERVRLQESIVTEVPPRIAPISAVLARTNSPFIAGPATPSMPTGDAFASPPKDKRRTSL